MERVRKITNISNASVPVMISDFVTLHLAPDKILEDINVYNLDEISKFVKAEIDVSEIMPTSEGKVYLKD